MQNLRQRLQGLHSLLCGQQGIRAGGAVKGEGAFAAGGDADDGLGGQRRGSLVQARRVHAAAQEHLAQIAPEGIAAHLADEAGRSAQPGGSHGHVGRRAAGIGGKVTNPALVHTGLGQIDQKLAQSQQISHKNASVLKSFS